MEIYLRNITVLLRINKDEGSICDGVREVILVDPALSRNTIEEMKGMEDLTEVLSNFNPKTVTGFEYQPFLTSGGRAPDCSVM